MRGFGFVRTAGRTRAQGKMPQGLDERSSRGMLKPNVAGVGQSPLAFDNSGCSPRTFNLEFKDVRVA